MYRAWGLPKDKSETSPELGVHVRVGKVSIASAAVLSLPSLAWSNVVSRVPALDSYWGRCPHSSMALMPPRALAQLGSPQQLWGPLCPTG